MSNKGTFDKRIKELLIKSRKYKESDFCESEHENYFVEKTFSKFVYELRDNPIAKAGYDNGNGGELKPHMKNNKRIPPKMASIASSSRFIYLLFKNKENLKKFDLKDANGSFFFEQNKKEKGYINLKNGSISQPNYDGYYESSKDIVYFEAKCHEVFDSHYAEWGIKYKRLFNSLPFIKKYIVPFKETRKYKSYQAFKKKHPDKLSQRKRYETDRDQDYIELNLKGFGLKLESKDKLYVDVKQLVCHLLGMANRTNNKTKARLIYLYYCPNSIKKDESIINKRKESFASIYASLVRQFKIIKDSDIVKSLLENAKATLEFRYSSNETMEMNPIIRKVI